MTDKKQELIEACHDKPDDISRWRKLGDFCIENGDTAGAREGYTRVARLQPSAESYAIIGSTWFAEGQFARAVDTLRMARRFDPRDPEVASALGCSYFHLRKFAAAKPLLIEAAEADPANEEAHMALARIAMAEQDFPSALEIGNLVLKNDPADALSPLLLIGDCFLALGELDHAGSSYQAALEVSPDNVMVLVGLAAICLMQSEYKPAEAFLRLALELDPESADAHAGLGNLLLQRNLMMEAEDEYRQAAKLSPDFAPFQGQLAAVLLAKGNPQEAEATAKNGLKLDPNEMGSLLVAAQCAELDRRFERSVNLAKRAVRVNPQQFHARLIAARALLHLGRKEDARDHLEKAFENAPTDKDKAKVEKLLPMTQRHE